MRSEEQIRGAERFAVGAKETATSDRTHRYAEGVQDALMWVMGDEEEIDGVEFETKMIDS